MVPSWSARYNGECQSSAAGVTARQLQGSALPAHRRQVERPRSEGLLRLVARERAAPGTRMATLYGPSSTAIWQVAAAGWRPRPRKVQGHDHNSECVLRRCPECSEWEAGLNTATAVESGEELTVGEDKCLLGWGDTYGQWKWRSTEAQGELTEGGSLGRGRCCGYADNCKGGYRPARPCTRTSSGSIRMQNRA